MTDLSPPLAARVIARPMHPGFLGWPFAPFAGALISDIAYTRTFDVTWKTLSDWLLAGGMVLGAVGAIIGLVDLSRRTVRANALIFPYAGAYALAMILALFNNFVHSRDAYGAMPAGLILSVLTVIVLTITALMAIPLIRQPRPEVIA